MNNVLFWTVFVVLCATTSLAHGDAFNGRLNDRLKKGNLSSYIKIHKFKEIPAAVFPAARTVLMFKTGLQDKIDESVICIRAFIKHYLGGDSRRVKRKLSREELKDIIDRALDKMLRDLKRVYAVEQRSRAG